MSHEGQLSANMQVDDEASVNWGASLGEGSAQGNAAALSQSLPNLTDLSSRGRSASHSPTPRGRAKSPNTVFRRGRSLTPRSKALGANIAAITEKLKRDFDAATSQTQADLAHAAITAESGQSIAQAAFQQTVERKKEIEHLHTTMQAAMQEHAVATETSTNQRLNALAEELTRRVGAVVEESQSSLLAKQNEELTALKQEIQCLQESGDVHEGTVLYNELSVLHKKVEDAGLKSHQSVQSVFATVNEQLAKMKQETASTVNSVLVKLTEQSGEQKAMVEAVGKMVAELKLMQGKLDTVQNWQTENEQKYAEMHADYMEYKTKNEETEGQQEGQPEAETSVPTFTFGQTVPQTEQTVPTVVKAEPSVGQAQGTFVGQPESSSHFVTPSSLLGNSPSSQQSGFGSDFTFPHTPLQQSRDNNPNTPPPPFPPPVGGSNSSATPQNIFTTTTWKPKDPPCFHGKSTEDAHAWVAMVRNYFIFMAGTAQQEVAYAATLLRDVAQEWWVGYLWRNHGKYPRDWDTMAQAILERFGSNLRAETAQAQLQYITQGSQSAREYSAEFELHMGRLESFDERSLIR